MRILRGVYEGPGSYGVLRVAASMDNVHAVHRALPGEGYFPALYGKWERDGFPPPVTLSPVWKRPEDTNSPGDLPRDIAGAIRRNPEARTVVLTRSEAALLSGEEPPKISLPEENAPKLVLCEWEAPDIIETEAAELALEDLVRANVEKPDNVEKSAKPSVNLFGPPIFGPGAQAEYDEVERLLTLIGVEVNIRVPLGSSPDDLAKLTRGWANLLLYREIGESATLYLQDEFGMGRVTTPMIGTVGTGAALKGISTLCGLERTAVQRAVWGELSRNAKLPWYARLAPPEAFEGRKAFIFGDFTYTLGLGHTISREVGLSVAACGTYMRHLGRDFLFHADTFTDDAFVSDDPDDVASRIERARPDLVIGTHLEEDVADSLGIPFLQFCPPSVDHAFIEQPLMGYAGSSFLADALENSLRRFEEKTEASEEPEMPWSEEAMEELEGIPTFLRGRAKRLAEDRAKDLDEPEVTREIFLESRL
jgi:light-independent protochlorophyllide reductase B subunit